MNDTLPCLLCPPLLSSLLLSSPLFSAQLNDTLSLIWLFFTTYFSLICLFFTLSMHESYSAFPPMLSSPLLSPPLLSAPQGEGWVYYKPLWKTGSQSPTLSTSQT